MKISSMPISSPGRTDKFPTPLMMRFLRNNVGSRSRGRSRSSPMFISTMRTKKNAAVGMNDTIQQEPSSPKVTCIGQVRARRASKAANKFKRPRRNNATTTSTKKSPCLPSCPSPCSSLSCCCNPKARFHLCCRFRPKFPKPKSSSSSSLSCGALIRKWVLFFRFGYCKKVDDARDDSVHVVEESVPRGQNHVASSTTSDAVDIEVHEITVQETDKDFLESSCPPKNALLLTRCRSAPYRSSSLAGRFWGLETEKANNEFQEPPEGGSREKPISSPPNSGNAAESRNSSRSSEQLLNSCPNERAEEEVNIPDLRGGPGHPLFLTRCKSEPARTGERLIPEVNLWRQRRSDGSQSCLRLRGSNPA